MRKLLAMLFAAAMAVPAVVQATVIDFNHGLDEHFYYTNMYTTRGPRGGDNGFAQMVRLTGGQVLSNPFGAPHASLFLPGLDTFTLNSLFIGGAWGTQTVFIEGILDGRVLYERYVPISPTPLALQLDWGGIDFIRIATGDDYVNTVEGGNGRNWVIDNLLINDPVLVYVPEPAPFALLGLGALALLTARKKRYTLSAK
ncbi:PEP-CTERM sorting domain-containing protein [Massilia sp. CF038]|uniref:PEP-CTERM sorting domain-containing protein n=1 Tax=Massilia sp. CF038 TaxID=1881045 RepID=UPI0009146320|nr:PEP-CTERM sorting domain-containing protein [Massilia sp. CF038]SHG69031.1 PEP-CTERM protein-sorting domain-containing protein [Massilia sp. CF038]